MIKVAMHIPNNFDATAYYRANCAFAHIRKNWQGKDRHLDFDFELVREWSGPLVMMKDLAFFQRPSSPPELEAIRICKRLGVPVIVDYDDLLFDLPRDNPAYGAYMNAKTQETIIAIMSEADCIWVSTTELKRCIQISGEHSLNDKVFVVPNALDDQHLIVGRRANPPPVSERRRAVLWRGSATHERDVMEYAGETLAVAEKHPNQTFVFVGYNPWFMTERMGEKQAVLSGALPVGEFMDFLYGTAPQIGIVPLHDSRFNRCKSNIAWLEMTWAGAVVLAPDWQEWRHPGVVTYQSNADYQEALDHLISQSPSELAQMNAMSWNHIQDHFTLSKVNPIRIKTMLACLQRGNWPHGGDRLPDAQVQDELVELG